ncbi:hypothetical protein Tco_1233431 [Tanacetum coccineum]
MLSTKPQLSKGIHHQKLMIGPSDTRDGTRTPKKHTKRGFYTEINAKEAHPPKMWDCHAGNPCAHILIQRPGFKINDWKEIKGQDQSKEERVSKT